MKAGGRPTAWPVAVGTHETGRSVSVWFHATVSPGPHGPSPLSTHLHTSSFPMHSSIVSGTV